MGENPGRAKVIGEEREQEEEEVEEAERGAAGAEGEKPGENMPKEEEVDLVRRTRSIPGGRRGRGKNYERERGGEKVRKTIL